MNSSPTPSPQSGCWRSAELARAALAPVVSLVGNHRLAHTARVRGIGAGTGIGSLIYGLTVVADLLDDDELRSYATELARRISDELIAADGDWCDRRTGRPHHGSQWCHGAVGIGLARLAIMKWHRGDSSQLGIDVDRALTAARSAFPGPTDTLCCGTLGTVELAREAGKVLGRADLEDSAMRWHTAVLRSKQVRGGYRWSAAVSSRFNVGLFRGLAGAGYTCLRAVDSSLPNLLIWD